MSKHIWIEKLDGAYPTTYVVTVDGYPYDSFTKRKGKNLTRDEMKSIADGYREWFDFEPGQ